MDKTTMTDLFSTLLTDIKSLTDDELYTLQGDAHIFGDKVAFKVITRELEDRNE